MLARIGLADRAGSKVRDLSGGQMRRLEIARALLHRPRLLLLDEATVGLDVKARADILNHVRRLVTEQGIGVLWATHLFDEIGSSDDLVVLHQGRVLAQGQVARVIADSRRQRHQHGLHAADRLRRTEREPSTMTSATITPSRSGFSLAEYLTCLNGIVWREALRFLHQRERFVSALVRPLVWLFIFAAGFRQVLGISIIPPYETYILYEVYIAPGLMAMIQLFNGMQSSLSMVYDREMGNMRTLLVSPLPRWFLLFCKLLAGTAVSLLQVYAFLLIAWFWDIAPPPIGYLTVLPALMLSGLMLGALGMLISSGIKQLENFAGVMNFVIFPMFFASSALYPLWRMLEGSPLLYYVCQFNPFTHAVELIRFALYGQVNWIVARGRRRLHDGLHDRRDLRLRSIARPESAAGRPEARHETVGSWSQCCLPFGRRIVRTVLPPIRAIRTGRASRPRCRRYRLPRCGQARRSTTPRTSGSTTAKVSALVAEAGGEAHAARRSREDDRGVSGRSGSRQDRKGKLLFAGLFDTLNAQRSSVMNGLERVTRKQREAADKIRADYGRAAGLAGRDPARPVEDRRTRQSTGLGNPDIRGSPARDQIRVRGAHCDRPTAVRARPHRSSRRWNSGRRHPSPR